MEKRRLEKLLKIREAERDVKRNALLDVENRLRQTLETLESIEDEIMLNRSDSRAARQSSAINSSQLKRFQSLRDRLSEKKTRFQNELTRLNDERETRRAELYDALKAVKTLQKLKEKNEEREREEENRRAIKTQDETTIRRNSLERAKKNGESKE